MHLIHQKLHLLHLHQVGVVVPPTGPPLTLPLGWLLPGGQVLVLVVVVVVVMFGQVGG